MHDDLRDLQKDLSKCLGQDVVSLKEQAFKAGRGMCAEFLLV